MVLNVSSFRMQHYSMIQVDKLVYVNVEHLVFVREPITVDFITGDEVVLSEAD
jgi:hypothetical protein